MSDQELDSIAAAQVEELWTTPAAALAEVFPSMQRLAGVWNEQRREAVIKALVDHRPA